MLGKGKASQSGNIATHANLLDVDADFTPARDGQDHDVPRVSDVEAK